MPEQPNQSFCGEVRATAQESTPWWSSPSKVPAGAPRTSFGVMMDGDQALDAEGVGRALMAHD
jgi:hypothetical protein